MIATFGKSILLVEDDAILALLEKKQLLEEGYRVSHVTSGEKALDLVFGKREIFDLILLDIDLGNGIDGTETATQILKQLEVPILFLSSHTERAVVRKTETITSYGYVVKNSGFTVLDASIKMAFKLFDAHENIKNKKEHLETVLHSIGDAVIATDKEGIVVKMNPVAEYLTGWKFDEGQGKKLKEIFKIINAKTRLEVENPVDIVLKTDKIVGLANHTVLISKNNNEFQIADSGSPIKDLNGETKGVVLVFRDVSKEYQIQKHIAEQANMLNHVMDAIIATDAFLNITYWNQAANYMYGWSEEEVIGKNSKEVLKTEFLNISREEIIDRLNNSGIVRTEAKQIRKDNTYIEIEANTILLKDDDGQKIGYLSVNRDITEKNFAKQQLIASQERFMEIIESAMDAIISIDKNKNIILFNDAAERMFGYSSSEMIGSPLDKLIPLEFRPNHDKHIDNFGNTGVSRRAMGELGQIHGMRSNGEIFPIEASISQIRLTNEKIYTVILRDVTLRNNSEEKIKKLLKEKENILKEIHHRVKNNMSAIYTLLTLQSRAQSDSGVKTILLEAASRVKSMIVLYDKLYHSSTDNSVSLKEYFPDIFKEILDIFPNEILLNLEIPDEDFELSPKLLSPLGIIINELITNSMKHAFPPASKGNIHFGISRENQKIQIIYKDNGLGIPKNLTFENSTGFGLQLISLLVSQINGTITMENDSGTKFIIIFEV